VSGSEDGTIKGEPVWTVAIDSNEGLLTSGGEDTTDMSILGTLGKTVWEEGWMG
jgi:hypothetical protein